MTWVSWRTGRNFGLWHSIKAFRQCRCGVKVPNNIGVIVNTRSDTPTEERCPVCETRDPRVLKLEGTAA
jgi:hypothetical protein